MRILKISLGVLLLLLTFISSIASLGVFIGLPLSLCIKGALIAIIILIVLFGIVAVAVNLILSD